MQTKNYAIKQLQLFVFKKYTIVTLLLISIFNPALAQFEKGSVWTGGNVNFYSLDYTAENIPRDKVYRKYISVRPFIGKSVKDNLILGINLIYTRDKSRSIHIIVDRDEVHYGGGFFARSYRSLGKGFFLFLHADLDASYGTSNTQRNEDPTDFIKSRIHRISLAVYPGVSYAINKKIHLELGADNLLNAYYNYEKHHIVFPVNNVRNEHRKDLGVTSIFNSNFSNFRFGFRYLLSKKKPTETNK